MMLSLKKWIIMVINIKLNKLKAFTYHNGFVINGMKGSIVNGKVVCGDTYEIPIESFGSNSTFLFKKNYLDKR
jgi:hypothetical protein